MWDLLSHTVRGPKNTFLLVVVHLESFVNLEYLRIFEKNSLLGLYVILEQWHVKVAWSVIRVQIG